MVCGKELRNVFSETANQPEEGTAFQSGGHYGSTIWDPMDGRILEINICDPCLRRAGIEKKVMLGQHSRLVAFRGGPLGEVVIGTTPVTRALVIWDPEYQEVEEGPLSVDSYEELEKMLDVGFRLDTTFTRSELKEIMRAEG
jgi:hypothetical protein